MIPHTIHQTWKTNDIPHEIYQEAWVESWKTLEAEGYNYRLWTDEDNRKLVADHYPWFLETYDAYDVNIKRVDAARYFILHHHGGFYVDLDFVRLKPMTALLKDDDERNLILANQIPDSICNAFMGSTPGHPVMEKAISMLQERAHDYVLHATGPALLTEAVKATEEGRYLDDLIPTQSLYPFDWNQIWNNRECTIDQLREKWPLSFACTMWMAVWHEEYHELKRLKQKVETC